MSQSLKQQFTSWVKQQSRDVEYHYFDLNGCAMFRFLNDSGYPVKSVGGDYWRDHRGVEHDFGRPLGILIARSPNTYGALADRLSA